jgi:hypothetical protein
MVLAAGLEPADTVSETVGYAIRLRERESAPVFRLGAGRREPLHESASDPGRLQYGSQTCGISEARTWRTGV